MKYKHLNIRPKALEALRNYKLPEGPLGFGKVPVPIMIVCDYKDGKWGELKLAPYAHLNLQPTAKVFHYAQEVFEGMKSYRVDGHGPYIFRPDRNLERFNLSCQRMAIPEIPEEYFMEAVHAITAFSAEYIPQKTGQSLYLRPFTIATEENLGIRPSDNYKFVIVACPSDSYFSKDTVPVMIERQASRAGLGGTGNAKTGGNYAASLISAIEAKKCGYLMTLWLDAIERRYIEELSGMNFFCVINGEIWTPSLTETILVGITRDSLIQLGRLMGYTVREEKIDLTFLIQKIKSNECTEAWACGTAAIVAPIECLGENHGTRYVLRDKEGDV
ncbi:MAG: branched-chain amino acid aminotransferase, partial [Bacteriovoracaceae bacterium]|nr:branched-chain amino acid aminotransferase [Bacteriovoracaceae bacterium]